MIEMYVAAWVLISQIRGEPPVYFVTFAACEAARNERRDGRLQYCAATGAPEVK